MTEKFFDQNLLNELVDNSHNPPGKDPVLGHFYKAVVQMVDENEPIAYLLDTVRRTRPNVTAKHLVNLLFRSYQHIQFRERDLSYRDFETTNQWHQELTRIHKDSRLNELFARLLMNKSTTTTIYQRYAGPYIVISYLLNGNPVSITDLGCGGNYGLRGIDINEPFKPIYDETPKQVISQSLQKEINLKSGIAIDKEDPDEEEVKQWRMACGFYPQELDQLPTIEDFERRIRRSSRVEFMKVDLLASDKLPIIATDVIILSTILYQLRRPEQVFLLNRAKQFLNPNGILIVQDFAEKDPEESTHLDFNESWFGRKFTYRTFLASARTSWEFLELLQWDNGRCNAVRPGQDFREVFQCT